MTHRSDKQGEQYCFRQFAFDKASRQIHRNGKALKVPVKVFDGIAYLIEHRDRAVGRDEFMAAVWGRADVTEAQLRQLVRRMRQSLDDDAQRQECVRTIPHFGFHWCCPVESLPSEALADERPFVSPARVHPAKNLHGSSDKRKLHARSRSLAWMSIMAFLGFLTGAGIGIRRNIADSAASTVPVSTFAEIPLVEGIGVLPVTIHAAGSGDTSWMRLGLMDLIAHHLRRAAVPVVASSDMVKLANGETTDAALAERVRLATGTSSLVMPSVTRDGDDWIVRMELHRGAGFQRTVEAASRDAIVAAREACDQMLVILGADQPEPDDASPESVAMLQRIEAAVLVDDFDTARRVVDEAPATLLDTAELQLMVARIDIGTGRLANARGRLETLLARVAKEKSPVLRARILTNLAVTNSERPEQSLPQISEAIALLEDRNTPDDLGTAYNIRGLAFETNGRYEDAVADYARARIAYRLASDSLGLARVDNNEAILDSRRGRSEQALPLLMRASRTFERFGALDKLAGSAINQISAYLNLLQPDDALGVFERAQSKLHGVDDSAAEHFLRYQGAESLAANGRYNEARATLEKLTPTLDRKRESDVIALVDRLDAELDLAANDFDASIVHARRAVDALAGSRPLASECAAAWLTLIRSLRRSHRQHEADAELERLASWSRDVGDPVATIRAGLAQAEQKWERRRPQAGDVYRDALLAATRDGTPSEIAAVASSYGNALLDVGDLSGASTIAGKVARWADKDFDCALLQARLYHALGQTAIWRAAMAHVRGLAGERVLPAMLVEPPSPPSITRQASL